MAITEIVQVLENQLESLRINLRKYREMKIWTENTELILKQLTYEIQAIHDAIELLKRIPDCDCMSDSEGKVLEGLKWLMVETGSLACFGCGREHNCGVHGCRILRDAAALIQMQEMRINELRGHTDE